MSLSQQVRGKVSLGEKLKGLIRGSLQKGELGGSTGAQQRRLPFVSWLKGEEKGRV